MDGLTRSCEGAVDQLGHHQPEHVYMDPPPPPPPLYMFTNMGESHYVYLQGPTHEVKKITPKISTFSFF